MTHQSTPYFSPIDSDMQERVSSEVQRYLLLAESLYQRHFDPIDVLFDLKGKTVGMYRVKMPKSRNRPLLCFSNVPLQRSIRFNPWLFAKYPEDSWENTIPHEVAHYISDCLYRPKKIRPHGKEWQKVMGDFGAEPIVRANYELSGIPVRQVRSYSYQCQCRIVPLSSYRHNKIQQGAQRYRCRDCAADLVYCST